MHIKGCGFKMFKSLHTDENVANVFLRNVVNVYPAGYATIPDDGEQASPALLGTVRPRTLSSLT